MPFARQGRPRGFDDDDADGATDTDDTADTKDAN
jgi:hypothetical protein